MTKLPKHLRPWLQCSLRTLLVFLSAVCIVLGVFRHFAAQPAYEARIQMFFGKPGGEACSPQEIYALARFVTSPRVLEHAVNELSRKPNRAYVDFLPAAREEWAEVLLRRLTWRSLSDEQGTPNGLVEIAYRSKDPQAAEDVLHATYSSYLAFLDEFLKPRLREDPRYRFLRTAHEDVLRELEAKGHGRLEAEKRAAEFGIVEVGPVADRDPDHVRRWVQAVAAVRQATVQLEATLAAIQAARRRGLDVRQYLPALEPIVLDDTRTDLPTRQTTNWPDAAACVDVERELRANRTELRVLLKYYGKQHPRVVRQLDRIRTAEDFLNKSDGYQKLLADRWALLPAGRLTSMLVQKAEERLASLKEHESIYLDQYRKADAESALRRQQMIFGKDREQAVEFLDKRFLGLLGQINDSLDRPRVLVALFGNAKAVKRQAGFWVTLCVTVGLGFALALMHVWERRPRRATRL